ncbi:MFS transporter [Escherichia coli]|nr:MFS transporter [Escherichia coli]
MTDGYVLGVIGYAIIQLTPAMQLTPFMAGMIGGSALLGLFLGSLVLGWISDHIGRQKIFTFSFLLITLASFLQFFATTPEHLIGLRILIGIGLGGDYSVGHTLLAEFSPRRHRGILLGAFSVVWTVGYVLASIAGHHFISENPEAWRWLLASAAVLAQETAIMLLDEPTTWLDISHQIDLLELLSELNREKGYTLAAVLHDLNQACRYASHLIALREGKIVAQGAPKEIVTAELIERIYGLRCMIIDDPVAGTPLVVPLGRTAPSTANS